MFTRKRQGCNVTGYELNSYSGPSLTCSKAIGSEPITMMKHSRLICYARKCSAYSECVSSSIQMLTIYKGSRQVMYNRNAKCIPQHNFDKTTDENPGFVAGDQASSAPRHYV